ncbi:MAG: hypothetical protein Q9184_004811, partial [Pyrenodesmia sp. 2 TL-2023]
SEKIVAHGYYSDAVLGAVHRTAAVHEWVKLKDGQPVSLERALAAFDQFVLHDQEGDLDEQLTGVADDSNYHNLQNNFIGLALGSNGHAALPLISVGIFCSVARRFGLIAEPCGFPFHVYAIVIAHDGQTLDGRSLNDDSPSAMMYMDPFRSETEVPRRSLEAQLRTMGVPSVGHHMLLGVSSTAQMVRRTAQNIIRSIQTTRNVHDLNVSTEMLYPESEGALYGALWALLLLPEEDEALFHRARYLPYILDHLEKQYAFDIALVTTHVLPLFDDSPHLDQLRDALRVMRAGDSMPKQVKPRTRDISNSVQFKIGQVFRHKRYNYRGVITGWDVECAAGETWMSQMGVDRLSRGRHQSFYHVLYVSSPSTHITICELIVASVEDKSVRYVAEENIVDVGIDAGVKLMSLAGRHFKRWERVSRTFISNIKDEYPND